ncbi:unnamed protein product [Cercopithifilaria johnstoni]|uniref:Uncharacterized protein n=1 Tax=Cercopithifilaria johnstoni TaxID=2874296 RepID=A0A8J2MRX8_9BILA|nr:unnamed protein product [Cercopithifilaria johnstoni]
MVARLRLVFFSWFVLSVEWLYGYDWSIIVHPSLHAMSLVRFVIPSRCGSLSEWLTIGSREFIWVPTYCPVFSKPLRRKH